MKEPKETSNLVKGVDNRSCGCRVTEYSDGRKEIAPCVPCGLFSAASNLGSAAEALAAVATSLRNNRRAIEVASVVDPATKSKLRPLS